MPQAPEKNGKPPLGLVGHDGSAAATARRSARRTKNKAPDSGHSPGCTDRELIDWYLAGDDMALAALFDRYEGCLFTFLIGLVRDHHLAEDALQETWCRVLQHLDSVNADSLRGWLFTIAYHQAMLYRRKMRGKPAYQGVPGQLADPSACPVSRAEENEEHLRVRELLDVLPQAQQDVIRQRIYEGKRFRDIADALECPLNTALARMHDGLKKLRRLWGTDSA